MEDTPKVFIGCGQIMQMGAETYKQYEAEKAAQQSAAVQQDNAANQDGAKAQVNTVFTSDPAFIKLAQIKDEMDALKKTRETYRTEYVKRVHHKYNGLYALEVKYVPTDQSHHTLKRNIGYYSSRDAADKAAVYVTGGKHHDARHKIQPVRASSLGWRELKRLNQPAQNLAEDEFY